jgi:hypothetical protein
VGASLTANDCVLRDLLIARRYRGGKPRQYWPFGVITDLQTAQVWLNAFVTACTTGFTNHTAGMTGLTWPGGQLQTEVNVSYYQGFKVVTSPTTGRARNVPTPRSTPLIDAATGSRINQRIATQRRRQHFST